MLKLKDYKKTSTLVLLLNSLTPQMHGTTTSGRRRLKHEENTSSQLRTKTTYGTAQSSIAR